MAKSNKTKKTPEQMQADLQALIGGGGITTLSELSHNVGQDDKPDDDKEQKGEKAPAAPPAVIYASAEQVTSAPVLAAGGLVGLEPQVEPALEPAASPAADELPTPTEQLADELVTAPAPVAAPQPSAADVSENLPPVEQLIASVSTPASAPEPAQDKPTQDEPAQQLATGPVAEPHAATPLDLAALFKSNPPGRKGITSRLSEGHYQYLQMLGTVLGNRTTVPEIVSNIIDLFIAEYDDTIQKALTKKLRAARTAPKNS